MASTSQRLSQRRGNNSTVDSVDETNGEPMELPDEITTDTEVHFTKRTRKSTSLVWKEFNKLEEADGTVKHLQCVHCGRKMTKSSSGSTTHLTRHLKACLRRQASQASQTTLNFQPADSKMEVASTFNGKYDHAKQREATAHWILMHEKPFSVTEEEGFTFMMQVNQPLYQRIPRSQSKRDCVSVYDIEKKKLKSVLQEVSKISLTTDLWKSDNQQISYMCLTGHFVDKDWKLQKRVLNFVDVPPPHGGYEIADALYKCLQEWEIDSKVCAIAVDNASYNDVAVRIVRDTVDLTRKLPLDGKLFHTRCAAHILNLMVQDGLSVIAEIVSSIHNSVAYINKTEGRILKFAEVVKQLQIPARKLIIDCPTRWNSTYEMLVAALNFKNAFSIFKGRDTGYKLCPTDEDWEKVENVCDVLGVFYDATQVISGSEYPTANLFLSEIYRVKEVLDEHLMSEHLYIQMMVEKMLLKFKKYWGECNMLMALGAVLDPRFKMMLIEFAFPILYSGEDSSSHVEGVKKALYDLYSHYVDEAYPSAPGDMVGLGSEGSSSSAVPSTTSTGRSKNGRDRASGRSKFNNYLKASENIVPVKSELDTYLEEGVLIEPSDSESDSRHVEKFEVFQWWKTNKLRFRVLSRIAIDILSIPITTVAFESTFSAGSRVIDDYRAKLGTETVQVCICGADWVRHLHGVKKKSRENKVIDVVLPIN